MSGVFLSGDPGELFLCREMNNEPDLQTRIHYELVLVIYHCTLAEFEPHSLELTAHYDGANGEILYN